MNPQFHFSGVFCRYNFSLNMVENYCTTREAAQLLGISLRTAQQWLEKGQLEGWKTSGGHRRIKHSSVLRILEEQGKGAKKPQQPYSLPVLIVEDDAALLRLYRVQIARWPFDVTLYTAPNGYEGLVMLGEVAPSLLISDLRLPGINGFQIVRSLCAMARYQDLVIVVVSGLPQREIDAHGGVPARVETMGKPIDFARLQDIAVKLWTRQSAKRPAPLQKPEPVPISKS